MDTKVVLHGIGIFSTLELVPNKTSHLHEKDLST